MAPKVGQEHDPAARQAEWGEAEDGGGGQHQPNYRIQKKKKQACAAGWRRGQKISSPSSDSSLDADGELTSSRFVKGAAYGRGTAFVDIKYKSSTKQGKPASGRFHKRVNKRESTTIPAPLHRLAKKWPNCSCSV